MIDTSPWSCCSRWSPWLACSGHTISSTGPSVSPFRIFFLELWYTCDFFIDESFVSFIIKKEFSFVYFLTNSSGSSSCQKQIFLILSLLLISANWRILVNIDSGDGDSAHPRGMLSHLSETNSQTSVGIILPNPFHRTGENDDLKREMDKAAPHSNVCKF